MRQGELTYKKLGYDDRLSRGIIIKKEPVYQGEQAGGDLKGPFPRPQVDWSNIKPKIFTQATEPTSSDIPSGRMAFWEDTDDSNKLYLCYNQSGTIKTVELT